MSTLEALGARALEAERPGRWPSSTRAAARRSPPAGATAAHLAPAALAPEALAERVRAMPVAPLAVGDGAVRFRGSLEAAGAQVPPDEDGVHRLRAEQVCKLGAEGSPTDRDALLPDYLREPDAVPRR